MKGYTIEQMRDLLSRNVVEIRFVKKDDSPRVMLASTNVMYIPEQPEVEHKRHYTPNPNILVVVDTELGEWRSIRFDSIQMFTVTNLPVVVVEEEEPESVAA